MRLVYMGFSRYPKDLEQGVIQTEENRVGIYEILTEDEVLYIGTGPIRSMLREHLEGGVFPIPGAKFYRTFSIGDPEKISEMKQVLLEDYREIIGEIPKYNQL
jgi:hypothetical protein